MKAPARPLDRNYARNVAGICSVEALWGLGMPVVIESTFLQLFLRQLGASSLLIGLIPTLMSAGIAVSSLFSYTLTVRLPRKRPAVLLTHVLAALPIIFFGLFLSFAGIQPSLLSIFLGMYALFSIGVGLLLPVWQTYIVKIFSEAKTIPAMASMMIAHSAAKLAGSLFLVSIVERYSFSARGAALAFTAVGVMFLLGSFAFLFTEEEADEDPAEPSLLKSERESSARQVFRNRRFLVFLGTEIEYFALAVVISFYANYATEFCGVSPALASGLFIAFNYLGGVLANVLLGWVNFLSLRGKYLATKSLALAGILFLTFHSVSWVFYLTSLLFGASRGTRQMMYAPAVKQLSASSDATLYFAVAPVLVLPLSTGLPLLNGALLDRLAPLGALSYRIVFLLMAVLALAGLFFSARIRFGPSKGG